jgi:hypothetical protein
MANSISGKTRRSSSIHSNTFLAIKIKALMCLLENNAGNPIAAFFKLIVLFSVLYLSVIVFTLSYGKCFLLIKCASSLQDSPLLRKVAPHLAFFEAGVWFFSHLSEIMKLNLNSVT